MDAAEKDKCVPIVQRPEDIEAIRIKAEAMMNHEGPFKILPNYGKRINKAMLDMAVNYKLITPEEAELIFSFMALKAASVSRASLSFSMLGANGELFCAESPSFCMAAS